MLKIEDYDVAVTQIEEFQSEISWLVSFADPVQGGCAEETIEDMDIDELRALISFLSEGIRHVGKLYEAVKG